MTNNQTQINGDLLYRMIMGGFASLSQNKEYLNGINVFPVSDADTGTNMSVTFNRGLEVLNSGNTTFNGVLSMFSKGMLFGSRGNSGFLLSQYFLGIHEYTKDKETATVVDLSKALQHAYEVAYKAILRPAEGTMLTIMREGIKRTLPKISSSTTTQDFFRLLVSEMFLCVKETVKQMSVLKDNNIVDSGALGLYLIFDGMKRAICGEPQYFDCEQSELLPKRPNALVKNISFFRYCTEFVVRLKQNKDGKFFINYLEKNGDSLVIATDGDCIKVHIHSNIPEEILKEFSKYGDIITKKIDDLFKTEEFDRLKKRKHPSFTIIAFTSGDGNATILEQLGADVAFSVPYGYTPSESELKMLVGEFAKENLIIFADNKSIREKLQSIKWFGGLNNCFVAECDTLSKIFFTLSSLVFSDKFKEIVKSFENLKKQNFFETSISVLQEKDNKIYSGYLKGKLIKKDSLVDLLDEIVSIKVLESFSTVVVFGGKNVVDQDIDLIQSHFENNDDIECAYLEGRQQTADFIIGAY